ncbi:MULTISPECIES: CDP-alcohol phosphatidyltransferase family protein [unclassified Bosea (in: a-proteobacteria)]|uniref:CDP-alcohol phosphatidyltransferase family protein n=1 Tax=unclassified Bosea (in: a-proteobacteria) TaxID=2653178 RepID=UPI000F74EA34|nr:MULTISPECIES: CDP-alcohol phosphatidyltransferase family protein [unclassified Bosea (in: a-proteobacteria)]AZO78150.1 CDP-diacylglycerol--glycerol-3-phosphate 3-phosphatidyltransferase [Bosea sp. Tri-49]RXT20369.1 CDP-diacylglycerol--glycerol-3-phosphate 3-phosphatidyltransferase [Bosea sp. Tri-39]RXT37241.1 CDP-diacylglycerol--glycerol-3-phosphate 3-phosphatidyltransferase [Bosea sp. Tri-54]
MAQSDDRRPLSSRDTGWARAIARRLSASGITPNQISIASMVMAAFAGAAFWLAGTAASGPRAALLLAAALFCQLRLLCNLFDGMVAIEGGKQAADGPFWNEFPDRIADILILTGVGYGIGTPALGWAAAGLAVLTAYTRELGRNCGLPADFSGPMAKQHRMATITAAALLSLLEPLWRGQNEVLVVALWLIAAGAAVTALRRATNIVRGLRAR